MFVEIKKINTRQEEGKAFINTDNIVGMTQQPKHTTRLYNENQELVSETEDTPRYAVLTNCKVGRAPLLFLWNFIRFSLARLDADHAPVP